MSPDGFEGKAGSIRPLRTKAEISVGAGYIRPADQAGIEADRPSRVGPRAAVAVLGTRYRGDDAVGPLVGDRLRERGVEVLDCGDDPTRLVELLAGLDTAVIVDAIRSSAAPGTVHRAEALSGLPHDPGLASTHALSVIDVLTIARLLGRAPRRLVVVGIEARAFGMGDPLTPEVEAALDDAVAEVVRIVGATERSH